MPPILTHCPQRAEHSLTSPETREPVPAPACHRRLRLWVGLGSRPLPTQRVGPGLSFLCKTKTLNNAYTTTLF